MRFLSHLVSWNGRCKVIVLIPDHCLPFYLYRIWQLPVFVDFEYCHMCLKECEKWVKLDFINTRCIYCCTLLLGSGAISVRSECGYTCIWGNWGVGAMESEVEFILLSERCYVPYHRERGGHIDFIADPVGVGVLVGVASCLHSTFLMNGWILAKLIQIYHWVGEKCWLEFDDLDPIFKVTWGLRLLEKAGKLIVCTLSPERTNGFWPYLQS